MLQSRPKARTAPRRSSKFRLFSPASCSPDRCSAQPSSALNYGNSCANTALTQFIQRITEALISGERRRPPLVRPQRALSTVFLRWPIEAPRRSKSASVSSPRIPSELVALRSDDIDLATGRLHVRRAKSGDASVRASNIGAGKSGTAQAAARSANIALRLHLGTPRPAVRSRISAHGGQGWRGGEIHVSCSLPHAAPCLRVQARE